MEEIIAQVIATARRAGDFIQKERENFNYDRVEIKGLNDLVSYVDKGSEKMIVEELALIMPEAGFIVEENSVGGKKEYNWIVDPLDGTTNFIHGIPCYAVSIGLERNGEVIAGVVYEVSRNECFYAWSGGGAFLNGKRINVSSRNYISESLVATGFPIYNFERLQSYLSVLSYFMKHSHGVRRIGAAAVDLCYLACGRVDAFFEYNLNAWDVAAGALIVKEAGGAVCDFKGGNNWLFGREIVSTNALLHHEFNSVIQEMF